MGSVSLQLPFTSQVARWSRICLHFNPRVRKIPRRGKRQPTPVFLPRKSHGQRKSLAGYSPWGHKESDTTKLACMPPILPFSRQQPGGAFKFMASICHSSPPNSSLVPQYPKWPLPTSTHPTLPQSHSTGPHWPLTFQPHAYLRAFASAVSSPGMAFLFPVSV